MDQWLTKTRQFIADTLDELGKCHWPSREELFESTVVVIASIVALSVFVWLVDGGSQYVVKLLTTTTGG